MFVSVTREFEVLLEDQAPLESYIEWLDGMVDQCVVQVRRSFLKTMYTLSEEATLSIPFLPFVYRVLHS